MIRKERSMTRTMMRGRYLQQEAPVHLTLVHITPVHTTPVHITTVHSFSVSHSVFALLTTVHTTTVVNLTT